MCACPQVAWDAGRQEEEKDVSCRFRGGSLCPAAEPRAAGETPATVSSSAAETETQDPDSTNSLESEAPRDYFLKCKYRALPRLLGWALAGPSVFVG